MNSILDYIKVILALFGGIFGWLFEATHSLIYALIMFVAIDYITGVLLAIREKKVSSQIGFKGISKKVMIFLLVALGNIIDQYVIQTGSTLGTMLIMFYLSNEGISIVENSEQLGLPIPQKLKDMLQKIEDNNDDDT